MSKLILVDGSALLHRAYHAYPPLTDKAGQIVGAVYGVVSMLISALQTEKPDYVVVAWDLPKPTFRHSLYLGYKAQRPKADLEMVAQIPLLKEVINFMELRQIAQEGFEADDIIGTLSRIEYDGEVLILTGDQDAMQLVTERVKVLTPPKGKEPAKLYGVNEVKEKYGVYPDKIVDYKALVGDASDNIPGVTGIGPKGAANLVNTFGSVEEIYQKLNQVKQKFGDLTAHKLEVASDCAKLSKELSRIVVDMTIETNLEDYKYENLEHEKLREKLDELGFRSLIRRIWSSEDLQKKTTKNKIPDNQMGLF